MAASPDTPLPHGTADDRPWLDALFLGPYGENDALLEKLVVEFLRDHVYWRRNFHPEDPPAISTHAALHPEYQALEARSEEHTSELQSLMRISYAVFCLKKKTNKHEHKQLHRHKKTHKYATTKTNTTTQ